MREVLTRYGRHNIGVLWLFVEPMIFTPGIVTLWSFSGLDHGSSLPIAAFAITGYSSVLLWRNMSGRTIRSLDPNLSFFYHRNVRAIDIFLSRLILELAGATTSLIVLSCIFHFLGQIDLPEDVLQVAAGWLMLAWFGAALAITLGAVSEVSETVEKLWHPASYLIFPLSGAAFMVDALPPAGQHVVLYLPMVHGVEFLREGFFGSKFIAHYDLAYMGIFNAVLTLIGLSQERKLGTIVVPQ
jgi:ABC-2 type transport system permease protein/capsular polysaccharide transport system permease protein